MRSKCRLRRPFLSCMTTSSRSDSACPNRMGRRPQPRLVIWGFGPLVHVAAVAGRLSIARDLLQGLQGTTKHLALAAIAEAENRKEDAIGHARAALSEQPDGTTRRQALLVLAGAGALQQEDVSDLPEQEATQLSAINLAESGRVEDAYALLRRSGGPETARYEHLTALLLSRTGNYDLAGHRLMNAATKFGEPQLRVHAARYLAQAGDWEEAVSQCLEAIAALDRGSPGWMDAHRLLIEGYATRNEWSKVQRYARAALRESPSDEPSRWVSPSPCRTVEGKARPGRPLRALQDCPSPPPLGRRSW